MNLVMIALILLWSLYYADAIVCLLAFPPLVVFEYFLTISMCRPPYKEIVHDGLNVAAFAEMCFSLGDNYIALDLFVGDEYFQEYAQLRTFNFELNDKNYGILDNNQIRYLSAPTKVKEKDKIATLTKRVGEHEVTVIYKRFKKILTIIVDKQVY